MDDQSWVQCQICEWSGGFLETETDDASLDGDVCPECHGPVEECDGPEW